MFRDLQKNLSFKNSVNYQIKLWIIFVIPKPEWSLLEYPLSWYSNRASQNIKNKNEWAKRSRKLKFVMLKPWRKVSKRKLICSFYDTFFKKYGRTHTLGTHEKGLWRKSPKLKKLSYHILWAKVFAKNRSQRQAPICETRTSLFFCSFQ